MVGSFSERFERADPADISAMLAEEWGFSNTQWSMFGSERDDTLRIVAGDRQFILKIAHPGDDPARITRQIALMEYARSTSFPFAVQEALRTRTGGITAAIRGRQAHLLTFLSGEPIRSTPQNAEGVRAIGQAVWHLQSALSAFPDDYDTEHPWALGSLAHVVSHVDAVDDPGVRAGCALIIEHAVDHTLPQLEELPAYPTHNDAHTDNVLVDGQTVVGIVDWGDSVTQPWVADLAVAASYARGYSEMWLHGEPWSAAHTLVQGYRDAGGPEHSSALFQELVLARLAQRIVLNLSIAMGAADGGVYARRNMVESMRDLSDLFASRADDAFPGLPREALW